jgi:pimeloyl-ACP methyl ester carboxylesterase
MNGQIVVNGQLVSYMQQGKKDAVQTLLFLHGWRSQKEIWNPVLNKLASELVAKSVVMYALDLPGFGSSPLPKNIWTVTDYSNLVAEFIKILDLKNVVIIGHSFGGRVGIKLASTRTDAVKKLVLVDAAGFAMDANKKLAMSLAAKVVKPFFKPKFMQSLRKKIYKKIGAEDYVATPELQKTFVNVVSEDLAENMKRILQPTLIVFGENDSDAPPQAGEKMHSIIPNSKFIILTNAGHFSFLDKPADFVVNLTEFL